jgi:hypothetical protein
MLERLPDDILARILDFLRDSRYVKNLLSAVPALGAYQKMMISILESTLPDRQSLCHLRHVVKFSLTGLQRLEFSYMKV